MIRPRDSLTLHRSSCRQTASLYRIKAAAVVIVSATDRFVDAVSETTHLVATAADHVASITMKEGATAIVVAASKGITEEVL